ncbi:MAG: hypothetical protein IT314_09475 [Anaerolineales bacterium]|nr:hypothetical protein [Anaerolineales bacterium]
MKRLIIASIGFALLASSCEPAANQGTTVPVVDSATSTPSPRPTVTATSSPSITPLPTIPTFTPTFDASTIVTVTPAPKAECPKVNASINPEIYFTERLTYPSISYSDKVLEFLNDGGDGQLLLARLNQTYPRGDYRGGYDFKDLTGDQIPEFLFIGLQFEATPIVFSCKNGKFMEIGRLSGDRPNHEYGIIVEDLNEDGIAEVIVVGAFRGSFSHYTIYLYKWNGQNFEIMTKVSISAMRELLLEDLDGNKTKELTIKGDNPTCISCSNFVPQRLRTILYGWNGKEFVEISDEFEQPKYRFQSIQDADAAIEVGKYDTAISSYNQAISDTGLEWWSPDRLTYEQHISNPVYMSIATPSALPLDDPAEYPSLAAYAYYRIMLLYFVQGNETEATTTYNTLQQSFGNDPYGQPYVEMATEFWEAYQSTHKMYDGCAAAIQYAVEHPEILIPLGSDYHGWQSKTYKPEDVCPFR